MVTTFGHRRFCSPDTHSGKGEVGEGSVTLMANNYSVHLPNPGEVSGHQGRSGDRCTDAWSFRHWWLHGH